MNRTAMKAKIFDTQSQEYRWGRNGLNDDTEIDLIIGVYYASLPRSLRHAAVSALLERCTNQLIRWCADHDADRHDRYTCSTCRDAVRQLARRIQLLTLLRDKFEEPQILKPYRFRPDLVDQAWESIRSDTSGNWVRAIKRYRELMSDQGFECSLRDAKDAIDQTRPIWCPR